MRQAHEAYALANMAQITGLIIELVADRFEQIEILDRERNPPYPVAKDQYAQQLAGRLERNTNAVSAPAKFIRMEAPKSGGPRFFTGIDVDRVWPRAKSLDDLSGVCCIHC